MKLTRLPYWCANPCEESLSNRISCTDNAMWVNNSATAVSKQISERPVTTTDVSRLSLDQLV
jgi:hypothetical protein